MNRQRSTRFVGDVPQRRARRGGPAGSGWSALMAAFLAPVLWAMTGLALALGFLLPLALAGAVLGGSVLVLGAVTLFWWGQGRPSWAWLCGPSWCPWLWSWICWSWVRWPRLCRHSLRDSAPDRPSLGRDSASG